MAWTTLCLGGYRPESVLVPALLITGLVVWLLLLRASGRWPRPFDPIALWPLPFLVYAGFNAAMVSPVPWLGWADWTGWAIFAAVHWIALNGLAPGSPRRWVHGVMATTAVVSVGLACYQRWYDPDWLMLGRTQTIYFAGRTSGAFGVPNSQAAMLLLLLPIAIGRAIEPATTGLRRVLAVLLTLIFLFGLYLTISRGAWLSLALAVALWPLLMPNRSWRFRLGLAAVALSVSVLVGVALYHAVPSVRSRLVALVVDRGETTRPIMWRAAWSLFREQPVLGSGAGSYNTLFERYRPSGFRDEPQWAHNDYLNTLSDYGVVGFGLLAGGFLWAIGRALRAGRLRERRARAITIGLVGFALSLAIDFHLKIPALAMFLAVILAEWLRSPEPEPESTALAPRPEARVASLVTALAVAAVGFLIVAPHYRAEAERYGPRREVDWLAGNAPDSAETQAVVSRGLAAFDRAVSIDPRNAQAWSDRAYALALSAHFNPAETRSLGVQSEEAARRALALSESVPEFWWRLGVALDMQGRWAEAGAPFARALALAPHSALAWYHQAYHYSLKPATWALARTAAATSLQMDGGHFPAGDLLRDLDARR
jgi:O-antigen ligase